MAPAQTQPPAQGMSLWPAGCWLRGAELGEEAWVPPSAWGLHGASGSAEKRCFEQIKIKKPCLLNLENKV